MRSGIASQAPESLAEPATWVGDPPGDRESQHSPVSPRLLGKPPSGRRSGRRSGRAERGSGQRGRRALPCSAPTTVFCAHGPSTAWSNRQQPQGTASTRREFEGKPARVTSGAGGNLGDSGASGATPRERGRRAACARRAPAGRGRRRWGGADGLGRGRRGRRGAPAQSRATASRAEWAEAGSNDSN